jgi:hypothetical protein
MHQSDVDNGVTIGINLGSVKLAIRDHLLDVVGRIIYCHPDSWRRSNHRKFPRFGRVICPGEYGLDIRPTTTHG